MLRPSSSSIRVFLFAEHRIVLECLRLFLNSNSDITVSEAVEPDDLDNIQIPTKVVDSDVAVIYLSNSSQVSAISRLFEYNPNIRIVVVADGSDLESQANALRLGAVGIVQINQNPKFLVEAIRQTSKGETWLNQVLLHKLLEMGKTNGRKGTNGFAINDPDSLTKREVQIIQRIGEGLSNKDLAIRLSISEATVRHHLSSINGKIGVEDRVNMVIDAYQKGILSHTN